MKKVINIFVFLFLAFQLNAELSHVEPSNWWVHMKESKLQILVHGKNISETTPIINYPGVDLIKTIHVGNPNYLFLYLDITPKAQSGSFDINFVKNGNTVDTYKYELKKRLYDSDDFIGFNNSDCIYLVQPDRFANGNTKNDSIPGTRETSVDRDEPYYRHGGDIQGLIDHLDYMQDMGFTALWPNPLMENDQDNQSYHGYAITDFYKVDPRYGTLDDYKKLSTEASKHGIKLIMDVILNHCGIHHWWMNDLPCKDWVNYPDKHTVTNHRRSTNLDPHASKSDADLMSKGWFVESMPDMNVNNDLFADYLIQNTIWWIETLKLGGIRIDTYPYPGKEFMSHWCQRVLKEYPKMNMVGEEWTNNPIIVSYWQQDKQNSDNYKGHLPALFDFPMQLTIAPALMEKETFGTGLVRLYEMLANDFIYAHPDNLVTFLGNHDCSRYLPQLDNNVNLAKNAMVWLFTMRGIPQFYYGDEILMTHPKDAGHGIIRSDFPGGFAGDTKNAFTGKGLTSEEKDFQQFVKTLLHWRTKTPAVQTGKMIHFAPVDGVYVYFRFNNDSTVMVVINKNTEKYPLKLDRFKRYIGESSKAWDIINNKTISLNKSLMLSPETPMILELK